MYVRRLYIRTLIYVLFSEKPCSVPNILPTNSGYTAAQALINVSESKSFFLFFSVPLLSNNTSQEYDYIYSAESTFQADS